MKMIIISFFGLLVGFYFILIFIDLIFLFIYFKTHELSKLCALLPTIQ